jgi:energy-coupling factor transporter ATP-binding protein EcfA2
MEKGYDMKQGARPMRRAIQDLLEDPLATGLLDGRQLHALDGQMRAMRRLELAGGGGGGARLEPGSASPAGRRAQAHQARRWRPPALPRIRSGLGEVDQVLGGGIVPGSVMLLSGDPGIGKSTLVLQMAAALAAKQSVLYVSGEESAGPNQAARRPPRRGCQQPRAAGRNQRRCHRRHHRAGDYSLSSSTPFRPWLSRRSPARPARSAKLPPAPRCSDRRQASQHRHFAHHWPCHQGGQHRRPKILEHLVDVVLYLEGERYGAFKALRGIKNRFGSTSEVGIFEMGEHRPGPGAQPVRGPARRAPPRPRFGRAGYPRRHPAAARRSAGARRPRPLAIPSARPSVLTSTALICWSPSSLSGPGLI